MSNVGRPPDKSDADGKPTTVRRLDQDSEDYPRTVVGRLGSLAPSELKIIGDTEALLRPMLANFCSAKCPGAAILQAFDVARALRAAGVSVAGGFHTPIERDCLTILLRGASHVLWCPARSIDGIRLTADQQVAVESGRLTIASPFGSAQRRITTASADARNSFVAATAAAIYVSHAAAGGKTEAVCRQALAWQIPIACAAIRENAHLVSLGATPVSPAEATGWAAAALQSAGRA